MDTWVGIDISKDTFDAAWITEDGELVHYKLDNGRKGFLKLLDVAPKESKFVMESTGNYHLRCAFALSDASRHVSVENPLAVKRHIQSDLKRSKNDRSDAFSLARYGMEKKPSPWRPPSEEALRARHVLALMDSIQKSLGLVRNNAHAFEQVQLKSDFAIRECRQLEKILKAKLDHLEKELERIALAKWKEEIETIETIPGVGRATACQLMVKVEDFGRFENSRQLISWMGLSPYNAQSGTSVNRHGGITRMGSGRLRTQLYMCSISASRCCQDASRMWTRMKEKGKPPKVAFVAIVNKILRIAFALVRKHEKYRSDFVELFNRNQKDLQFVP